MTPDKVYMVDEVERNSASEKTPAQRHQRSESAKRQRGLGKQF